jgi:hypothetical protein
LRRSKHEIQINYFRNVGFDDSLAFFEQLRDCPSWVAQSPFGHLERRAIPITEMPFKIWNP